MNHKIRSEVLENIVNYWTNRMRYVTASRSGIKYHFENIIPIDNLFLNSFIIP